MPASPIQLTLAWLILSIEGAVVIVGGLIWGYRSVTEKPDNLGASLAGAAFCVAAGFVVIRLALALRAQHQWARSPVIALEILFLPVGWALIFQGGNKLYGVPLLVVAGLLIYLLLSRPVGALLDRIVDLGDE